MKTAEELAVEYIRQMAAHAGEDPTWWWLSFQDAAGFRGVTIVRARFYLEAVVRAHEIGANPGGTVVAQEVDADRGAPPAGSENRLITNVEELNRIAEQWTGAPAVTLDQLREMGTN